MLLMELEMKESLCKPSARTWFSPLTTFTNLYLCCLAECKILYKITGARGGFQDKSVAHCKLTVQGMETPGRALRRQVPSTSGCNSDRLQIIWAVILSQPLCGTKGKDFHTLILSRSKSCGCPLRRASLSAFPGRSCCCLQQYHGNGSDFLPFSQLC